MLTAWIVGHTDRFAAAVVAKPVINWYSWVLTADLPSFGTQYWFAGMPWDNQDDYMKRSPLTYVGNVKTPTMLMTGEVDYRTPSSDAEQFYEALKLRKVPSVMIRVPDASHEISEKPSNMMAKVAYILGWFERMEARSSWRLDCRPARIDEKLKPRRTLIPLGPRTLLRTATQTRRSASGGSVEAIRKYQVVQPLSELGQRGRLLNGLLCESAASSMDGELTRAVAHGARAATHPARVNDRSCCRISNSCCRSCRKGFAARTRRGHPSKRFVMPRSVPRLGIRHRLRS